MDEIGSLLDGPRARGAFLLRTVLAPPWSIRIADEAPLALVALTRGSACLLYDDGEAHRLHRGDVAIMAGGWPYLVTDEPGTPVQVVIGPGQVCATPAGVPVHDEMTLGVRTWGNSPEGSVEMLVGTYQRPGMLGARTLAALPRLLLLREHGFSSPVLPLMAAEIDRDGPGQEVVLDRLLDLLLVAALRSWFARPDTAPGWYRASGDPVVGRAVKLMQSDPARPWTVASLAAASGASRAALARRFTELVGEPPMTFLAGWRLALAADLLRDTDATLETVARRVGYGSAFALSTAFKRQHGVSPKAYRAAG